MNIKNLHRGIILLIASAFFFSAMALFVRLAGDLPSMQKSFFRNIVAAFFAAAILIKDRKGFSFKRENLSFLIIRSFFGTLGLVCNFYAIDHLVLADAYILNKMAPFFAIIASAVFLKERLSPYQVLVVLTALLGTIFIIKPSFANIQMLPALIGLLGGLGAGLAYTTVRYLGQRGERGPVVVFFFSAFSCIFCLPFMLVTYVHMSWFQLFMLIMAGTMAALGQFSVTAAYFYAPAKEISVYDYTAIAFSTLWGFLFFGQIPDLYSLLGYIIIIAAAIANFIKSSRNAN